MKRAYNSNIAAGGAFEMCTCVAGGEWGEWTRGLGLVFTNPVGTGGVLDVCLCLGCGGVVGVGGKCARGLDQGPEGWGKTY